METVELSRDAITEKVDSIACTDSRERRRAVAASAGQPGCYVQVQGLEGGHPIPLDRGVVHLGRGFTADLYLDDSSISRHHAIIVPHGSGYRILDDRSLNGTFVNGQRIEEADLHHGDLITLGHVELIYHAA